MRIFLQKKIHADQREFKMSQCDILMYLKGNGIHC